ncbi:MAG: hypothetical protein EZS28_040971 [Streblomastix strix]|uniref:Uncharacterized protein n=1 Tax=Streblomastix strix TaxID=222440 RepID=A0A5J4U0G4_9EUKA|nr:MAG: hypothetical protein EZS28_040971 [Streblomastix strix]
MEGHRMEILVVYVTQDGLECVSSRSDGRMLTYKMIKISNFYVMGNLPVKLQFIACGSDLFSICIDVSEGKQLRNEQQSDKKTV